MKEKTALEKIRKLVGLSEDAPEIKLEEIKTDDDLTLFAERFEPGESIYVVQGEERIALPAGSYTLADGRTLLVEEEGLIASVQMAEVETETEMSDDKELDQIAAKVDELIKTQQELKKENEKMKEQLSKPVAAKLTANPNGNQIQKFDEVNLAVLSPMDRVNWRLFGNTRHSMPAKYRAKLAVSNTSAYAGEFAGFYIAAALLSGDTLAQDAITIKPNVAYQVAVKKVVTSGLVTDSTCQFTDAGDVTLTDRILTPKKLQINSELCTEDFEDDWEAMSMGFSAFKNMPPTLQAFILQHYAEVIGQAVEVSIWQGVAANDGEFAGFTTLLAADGSVVTQDSTAITSANVIAELGKVAAKIPTAVRMKPDCTIYVASNIFYAYVEALGGFGANGLGGNGYGALGTTWYSGQQLTFNGIKLFHAPGMPSGEMVAGQKANLWFGTGLMSDFNTVKVLPMADTTGSETYRYISRFLGGVQYGIGSDIVYYRTAP